MNALKVEPGSYVKPVAMFLSSDGLAALRSLGSTVGQFAIARICELRGFITIAVAPLGWYVWPRPASTCSVRAWISASIVSLRSWPCWALETVLRSISLPEPVDRHRALAARGPQEVVVGGLEPGEALVVGPDGPDHLGRELALGIDPPR